MPPSSRPAPSLPTPPPGLLAARVRDPYPYFAWLRRHCPVRAERRDGRPTVWQISRYETCGCCSPTSG
ncbi:hypothetical protein [Streptomyces sp. NBC_01264]|uniref:hypothetical protein n=1 Tax=Streptomyces sp. NBC_01264 TaxID=2903804 RepID=UPI002253AD4D|nr:hypothetical protein [Streptomyces sp. NBC_01264]MCX4779086.1 cytochrome P450 [Streptomyces sp. NBC_01264]